MKVLFDANVVLDILLKRPGWSDCALVLAKTPKPWISALSVANIAYILGRSKMSRVSGTVDYLRRKFSIASFGSSSITRALSLGLDDFEDAAQVAIAEENRIAHLVTGNLRDFKPTPRVSILSVADLAKLVCKN